MASTTVAIEQHKKNIDLLVATPIVVSSGITVLQGALVSIDGSGEGIDGINTSRIAGIAQETVVGDGVEEVVTHWNYEHRFIKSDAAKTDLGLTMYAADNQTATSVAKTAILGQCTDWESGYVWVKLTKSTTNAAE